MGSIIGAVAGIASGIMGEQAAGDASKAALTGYNYLTSGGGAKAAGTFINNGVDASNNQKNIQGDIAGLLGQGPNSDANKAAFNNYLNSTAYQFQLDQGTQGINANAATRGLLNSGANMKALATYGQNLSGTTFNNYLAQMGGLNSAYGATANAGETMVNDVGQAGTSGGQGASNAILNGANAMGNGIQSAAGSLSSAFSPAGFNPFA
jgi:hypothetical protein